MKTIKCERCGIEVNNAPNRKYCPDCRKVQNRELEKTPAYRAKHSLVEKRYKAKNIDRIRKQKREYQKKYRKTHPAYAENKIKELRTWVKANVDKMRIIKRVAKQRRRAIESGNDANLTASEWRDIKASYSGKCVYCGKPATTMDHVVPLVSGGKHAADNVVPACASCNAKKNRKPLLYFLYRMLNS